MNFIMKIGSTTGRAIWIRRLATRGDRWTEKEVRPARTLNGLERVRLDANLTATIQLQFN